MSKLPVDDALAFSDHMARMLEHADVLLAEWEAAARKAPDTLRDAVAPAVAAVQRDLVEGLRRPIEAELARLRAELARVQQPPPRAVATSAAPSRTLARLLAFNVVVTIATLAVVLWPRATPPPPAPIAEVVTPPPPRVIADASPPVEVVAPPASAPAPIYPCSGLLKGVRDPAPRELVLACAAVLCPEDGKARPHGDEAWLKHCLGGRPLELGAKLLEAGGKLGKLTCHPQGDVSTGYEVRAQWLHECMR